MVIYLIRHGETDWNRQQRMQGRMNVALNETGVHQAMNAAERLLAEAVPIQRIISSPQLRAMQSARIIAERLDLSIQSDERFAERGFGELEGLTRDEIAARYGLFEPESAEASGYGIEPAPDLLRRVNEGIQAAASAGSAKESVLIVTHGSVIRLLTGSSVTAGNGEMIKFS